MNVHQIPASTGLRVMMALMATHAAVLEDGQEHTVMLVSSIVSI